MYSLYADFTNLYSVSKTLRFELRPKGNTMVNLSKTKFFEQDEERSKSYVIMKKIIDDYHKQFIDDCLSKMSVNWQPLADAIESSKKNKDDKSKINLKNEQKKMREEIEILFQSDNRFEDLFSEKLISKLIAPEVISRNNLDEIKALKDFNKFSGYFLGLHENRKNMYSEDEKHTAIAYRIVNENFAKHIENCHKFLIIKEQMPELIQTLINEIRINSDANLDKIFSVNHFNNLVRQKDITVYNEIIGGVSSESMKAHQGINEYLNLYSQKIDNKKRIKMTPLFKQILCDRQTHSFIPQFFSNDLEIMNAVDEFNKDMEMQNIFSRSIYLLDHCTEYDTSKIYVNQKDIPFISTEIFGSWNVLGGLMQLSKADELGDERLEKTRKKIDKWLATPEFTLDVIIKSIEKGGLEDNFKKYVKNAVSILPEIEKGRSKICLKPEISLLGNESEIQALKSFLDSMMYLLHMMKPFYVREDADRDLGFYSEFDEVYESFSALIPLYNKIRNYVTKKPFNMEKIKLNFSNPTLAAGWDLNKEWDNTAIILRRDKKYFLGVMDPKKNIDFKKEVFGESTDYYEKMVYKLLPGPNKMLPKVFFSKKNYDKFSPSEYICIGYDEGKHKKGKDFDLKFCHDLIDFFKISISKHEDWKKFDFKFSPTNSYEDIGQFYKEVEKQGYKVSFSKIPIKAIENYVDEGRMFLFQLYTKDFSDKSKGTKNMHTLYWNEAFSDENLKDVVIKINGDAELFYRKKSNIDVLPHKAGDVLVDRKDSDGNPIPEKVYYELFRYKTGRISELSIEAKPYADRIRCKEAHYDIIKDRRYTEDHMFFHVPLTLNFKVDRNININKMVIDHILPYKDLRIIGIDRGERNLIYVSVIDRQGNIIDQKSFNIIDNFDYHIKLDQREKERADSRKSWNSIEKIKDLKEGYLSKVIHEISKMVIENNAIVILEDLNFGFKRGRFKVEKQVYQKFESTLINKLNYLVFKDIDSGMSGGVLKAYQLTDEFDSFTKLGKQTGVLFYVPASYTSKIDPTTGFVNIFNTTKVTNTNARKEFLQKFESIYFDAAENAFAFRFDYRDFDVSQTDFKNIWTVYTKGTRIKYIPKERNNHIIDPTQEIRESLLKYEIKYSDQEELLGKILSSESRSDLINTVYYAFQDTLQMRNSDQNEDLIKSPVRNGDGTFFCTNPENRKLPVNADANGAYHIALKGELMLRMLEKEYKPDSKMVKIPIIDTASWLRFVQTR
ncbi:MAG: type V CRISPR-associated protein Cas12a/Cpf1 [Candidatus Methanomethylophilaceae archaeon]